MAADNNSPSENFVDEASRLKDGLRSCRAVLANYRAMLNDSSNDNLVDDLSGDDSELG